MPEREPLTDEEYTQRGIQDRMRTSFDQWFNAQYPAPSPAPVAPAPLSSWKINWPGVAMPGWGPLFVPETPAAPLQPAPAAGPIDRPVEPGPVPSPAAPDVGIARPQPTTGDERWEMSIPVPPSVATAWETRTPPPAPPAPDLPAAPLPGLGGPGSAPPGAVPPQMAEGALMAIAVPQAAQARLQHLEDLRDEQTRLYQIHEATVAPMRERRKTLEDVARSQMADYRAGLAVARPPAPTLKAPPPVPDLKIRPWLDPEGKSALTGISQTLAMIAVGIAGAVNRTPLTAMKYFRESAEAWRRDEVDTANSRFKQFEAEVQRVKHDNELALTQYELADKAYAHNVDAKRAAVVSALSELQLHDQALEAATKPYAEAMGAVKARADATTTIQTQANKYLDVAAKWDKAHQKVMDVPKTKMGYFGLYQGATRALQDPTLPPERRAELEKQQQFGREGWHQIRRAEIADAQAKNENVKGAQIAAKRLDEGHTLLNSASYFEKRIEALLDDYTTAHEAGGLPQSNTIYDKWVGEGLRNLKRFDPAAQGALRNIRQFYAQIDVGQARSFLNDRGVQSVKAFGPLTESIMSYPEALAVIGRWKDMIADAKANAQRYLNEGRELLQRPDYRQSLPPEPEPTEPSEE